MKKISPKRTSLSARNVSAMIMVDDDHIALATNLGDITIVNLETKQCVHTLKGKHEIDDLVLLEEGVIAFVATGASHTYVKTWNYRERKTAKVLYKSEYRSNHIIRIDRESGIYLAIFSDLFRIVLINPDSGACVTTLSEENRHSAFLLVSQLADSNIAWLSMPEGFGEDNSLQFRVYDPKVRETLVKQDVTEEDLQADISLSWMSQVVYSSFAALANDHFAIGYYTGAVRVWGVKQGQQARYFQASDHDVNSIAGISKTLFATEKEGKVKVWRLDTLENVGSFSVSEYDLDKMKQLGDKRLGCFIDHEERIEILDF